MVNNDLVDEMVEPAQDHNAEQEQANDGSDNDEKPLLKTCANSSDESLSNGQVARSEDQVSSTSLYCSLPLNRDVQSIIDTFPKSTDSERKKTRKLHCLYCERTFVGDGLRQKHVERCHSVKQARRSSSRFQQGAGSGPATLQCQFCDAFQPAAGDDDLNDLFHHLVGEHSDRYFACLACRERFVLKTHLDEHKEEEHGIKREHVEDVDAKSKGANQKSKTKDLGGDSLELNDSKDANNLKLQKDEILEQKELRSRKTPIKSTKLGTKRSARLQNKDTPQPSNKNSSASSTISSSSSTSSKKKSKTKEVIPDPTEREVMKVASHENPYPSFDAFYRVKKITDHSIDNLRITSLTFSDVFDQAFYTRIKCNIADNLQNHIDGKLFKNEESESRISNFEKSQAEMKPAENNYGCEISLHAATPVASFLSPQLGDDPEAQIEYGSKASKKKTKPDEVHYKYFTRRKYQASIQEIKENRDLSKLDMWTQYVVKNRQQAIANTAKSEKEKQDYKKGGEYRAKLQNEELNRILDRRGPFEDLKLEANKQAVLEGNSSRQARVVASCFLEDVLHRVFEFTQPEMTTVGVKTELTDTEMPDYLNLVRASLSNDTHVDRSDKITLICSSEETENFEAPQVSPRDKHALVELSGEWTRSRLFICAACGMQLANMRALIDHKNIIHQNVWCQHYEFVGKQGAYYRNLSIPGLGKMDIVERTPMVKSWIRSTARQCTKCKKMCNTLGELHRHILECGEDWSWMLIRKKCKYRPYGAKTRRKRRGLLKRHESTTKKENKEKKTYKRTERSREKPSDAETIQRMLANLPAKRATRTEMSLKDGFPKANKKIDTKNKNKVQKTRAEKLLQESATIKRKVMVASKCNPVKNVRNVRKSVRNLNKVISSSLIDNNIMVRRKFKAIQAQQRATRARKAETLPEAPVELTEEQRAEEVKKKISLFKKVQKFRQSVIKKRTTKVSSSSAESVEKLATAAAVLSAAETVRKTRSASNLTDNSSASSDRLVKSPTKKKLRGNFGAKLMRTLTMRRRNKNLPDAELVSSSSTSTSTTTAHAPKEKRKKRFAGIKKVVKKLKVTNQNKKEDKKVTEVVEADKCESGPSHGHFLEESIRANAIRTISELPELDKSDNDNSLAIEPLSSDSSDKLDKDLDSKTEHDVQTVHQNSDSDTTNASQSAPIITITLDDKQIDVDTVDNKNTKGDASLLTTVNALTETLSVAIITAPDRSQEHLTLDDNDVDKGITNTTGQLTSPPILPSLSPLLGRSKNKLCKRAKGLNDCIAMLTSKLQCKDDTPVVQRTVKEAPPVPVQQQQQPETPVVVAPIHYTSTEEQNVVIPEETVSENLESAKEPEAAPPSPLLIKTPPEEALAPSSQTSITISDLSSPVIEQDKENIELEQKSLIPAMKQGYDVTLEKVVDLIKCFEDIHPKEIRNGHLDHAKADVINSLKGLSKKTTKPAVRKIGSNRKAPNKRVENRTFVQEQLNIARLEQDLILNDFERKIGSRRSLPQRKTKKTFVDLKIPEIKLKDRSQTKSVPKKNLSVILEESQLFGDTTVFKSTTDKTQVTSDTLQVPHLVHAVQQNLLCSVLSEEKDELPVDLSLTRKPVSINEQISDDVPVDLSTRKISSVESVLQMVETDAFLDITNSDKVDVSLEVTDKAMPCEETTSVHYNANTLKTCIETPIENEDVILENKAIPQSCSPSPQVQLEVPATQKKTEANSESEDELPLAKLVKTKKNTECDDVVVTVEEDKEIPLTLEGLKTSDVVKSQIQDNFTKKVRKSMKSLAQNRKRKCDVASNTSIQAPIVISDEDCHLKSVDNDKSGLRVDSHDVPIAIDSLTNHSAVIEPTLQDKSNTSEPDKCNVIVPEIPVESVVCTPDFGLHDDTSQTPLINQSANANINSDVDFEDVIPLLAVVPLKTNEMNCSDLSNNGKIVADVVLKPKTRRGRKPRAKLENLGTCGKKIVSVTDHFNCSVKQLNFGAGSANETVCSVPDVETTKEVTEQDDDVNKDVVDVPTNSLNEPEVIEEVVTEITKKQSVGKPVTLKTRKKGRPKSKRGKRVATSKKIVARPEEPDINDLTVAEKQEVLPLDEVGIKEKLEKAGNTIEEIVIPVTSEIVSESVKDILGENEDKPPEEFSVNGGDKEISFNLLSASEVVSKESTNEELDTSVELKKTPRGRKAKRTRKGKKTSLKVDIPVVSEVAASIEEHIEDTPVVEALNPDSEQIIDEVTTSVEEKESPVVQTPIKIKAKRGRKPKAAKLLFEPTVEPVENQESLQDVDSNVDSSPSDHLKTRSRKRKSDELNVIPSTTVDEVTNSISVTTTCLTQLESDPKISIAIYDFDEEDDTAAAGNNSKENVEQPKTKATKQNKRNGQSPSKAHVAEDEDTTLKPKDLDQDRVGLDQNISHEEIATPLKDVQNESFIQTPDLNDSVLASKIVGRFKVKKGKNSKAKKFPVEANVQEHYCDICNKMFGRLDSLNKHKRTLTHIAKLSEIEAFEAEAKKKQKELEELASQEGEELVLDVTDDDVEDKENEIEVTDSVGSEETKVVGEDDDKKQEESVVLNKNMEEGVDDTTVIELPTQKDNVDITVQHIIEKLDESKILSPTSEFMRGRSHSDVTKSMLVTSPFSLKTNNDSLRLADIISDVLNKPVENMENYTDVEKQSQQEPKRYKSLGERKSFDSDSVAHPYTPSPPFNISPASTLINKSSSDEFLKNQLSLLENIIEENKASFEYMDEASVQSVQSVQSVGSDKSDHCPSDMSLVSDIKADSSGIISSYNDERNFVKPNAQYEEISEDSMNNRNYEHERSRKTLNRDEELFLECCSLLKSSSEVSESKQSRAMPVSDYNVKNRSTETNERGKMKEQGVRKLVINDDDFLSDSCPNTPICDTYEDFSNSDTIHTDWSTKMNEKTYEDISQSSAGQVSREENSFKAFNFKLDPKSDIDESSNSVDFRKNINAKFVGLMAEAMKGKSPRRKKQKERRKSDTTQTSIIDYAVQLTPKSSSNSTDNFTDFTNDSKKVMTKGAMKVFEGLKVSIPTDEIDMNQVLDCSPTSKRLEIEESAKIMSKSKAINFGNKLGLKVTKKRNFRNRKSNDFLTDGDKILDVYDFEETQDNTDLFSSASKIHFRNGNKLCEKTQDKKESKLSKKAKLIEDVIESESESNNQDLDSFGAEVQSVNSFSTETESSISVKPPSAATTQENITKKKCQIMGRIFKNAFKAKVDGTKESTPVDDGDALENYIIGGPLEGIAASPSEKLPVTKERPKMSEKEMDLLFDKLLERKEDQALKVDTKTLSNTSSPLVSPLDKSDNYKLKVKAQQRIDEEDNDEKIKDSKENKKKVAPKSGKPNRRRSRKHSETSDDEFNLTKSPKKRQIRKSKPRDNGINLDEEIKECMGVAGRKSQRKCTSGKQNVLIEYWSSDDSEFEAMLRLSMQEAGEKVTTKLTEKTKESRPIKETKESKPQSDDVNVDSNNVHSNCKSKVESVKETKESLKSPIVSTATVYDDFMDEPLNVETPTTITTTSTAIIANPTPKNKTKRTNSNAKVKENKTPRAPKAKHPRVPRSAQDEETLAANRRKRAAVDTLYYWSSSSDDDTQNLIEVKSVRDDIEDEEDRPQHGWIVGDSPKKLVTLLAHAKGKKTNR